MTLPQIKPPPLRSEAGSVASIQNSFQMPRLIHRHPKVLLPPRREVLQLERN